MFGYSLYAAGILLLASRKTQVLAPLALYFGCRAIIRGRKAAAETAADLLARDRRPPVLYLRSFEDDEEEAEASEYARGLILRTTEEVLAAALKGIGPFIAIGRPGEKLASLGAARLAVDAQHWQSTVLDLMGRSRLVVLHLGSTGGLWWEVERALAAARLSNLLFFIPVGGGPMYDRLASLVKEVPAIELPEIRRLFELSTIGQERPVGHFLFFDQTGSARLSHIWPVAWQRGRYSELSIRRALRPVLSQMGLPPPTLLVPVVLKWVLLFLLPASILRWTITQKPRIREAEQKVRVARARLEMSVLNRNLEVLKQRNGAPPGEADWLTALQRRDLVPRALKEKVTSEGVIKDPWGFPYKYHRTGTCYPNGFGVVSLGADGKPGGVGENSDVDNCR